MEKFDMNDILKRNREFAKITNLTSILIDIDNLLQNKEDTLLDSLFDVASKSQKDENLIITSDMKKEITECSELKNFLKRIKREYNILPGCKIDNYDEKYVELEEEARKILNLYRRRL